MTGRLPGGIAGIVLGILSLLAVVPRILFPIAAILVGLTVTLGTWAIVHLNDLYTAKACEKEMTGAVARAGVRMIETLEASIGCGSIALGVLAFNMLGVSPVTLTLVAVLALGWCSLLNGTIFSHGVLRNLYCEGTPVV